MKPAPPPRMVPMEHSLRRKLAVDLDKGAADDGELRQFITSQLSSHASHVANLLDGLEKRITDTVQAAVTDSSSPCAQTSALRHASSIRFMDPNETVDALPGTVHDNGDTPQRSKTEDDPVESDRDDRSSTASIPAGPTQTLKSNGVDLPLTLTETSDALLTKTSDALLEKADAFLSARKSRRSKVSKSEDLTGAKRKMASMIEDGLKQEIDFAKDFTQADTIATTRLDAKMQCHERISYCLFSRPAELVISFLIIANAIFIGVQVDAQMTRPRDDVESLPAFRAFDIFFSLVFMVELIFRLLAEGKIFFLPRSPQFQWNWFDFCLVLSSIMEEILKLSMDSTPDVSMLRLFRIVRLVRLFRILRVVRFFKDLRIMISGIANSLQSLVWALLLMFCVMYLVAVFVLQYAADEGKQRANGGSINLSDEEYKTLLDHFGTMSRTMFTLYASITGGLDWSEASDPLFSVGWILGCFYICYIAFSVLCVMNIVTGVFVENCNRMTAKDEDLVYMEQLEQRKQWYSEVKEIFETADEKKTGFLSLKDFSSKVKGDARLRAWMRKIGVHVETYTARGLFQLLDLDGDGLLDFDEFFIALQQVHGTARSIDVAKVLHDTKLLRRWIVAIMEKLGEDVTASQGFVATKSWNKGLWSSEDTGRSSATTEKSGDSSLM